MKNFLLLCFLFLLTFISYSQNKTLGVGVAVPNPNAALDVDSPTGNQGMLLPRLTSAQITALGLVLGAADKGMLIYNKDTDNLIIWNGTAFGISLAATSTSANAAILGTTTGTGPAGVFQNTNAANTSSALYGVTSGTGLAIAVRGDITNAANASAAVYGSTVGSGVGLYGISTGSGAAIQGYTATGSTAIYGQRDGATNGNAGLFSITNAANTSPSLRVTTIGTGNAGFFQISNAASGNTSLYAETNGTGYAIRGRAIGTGTAGYFRKDGATVNSAGVWGDNFGTRGYAAIFQNIDATNPDAALFAEAVGTGPSVWANKAAGESGLNLLASHDGVSGNAGRFQIGLATNASAAIGATTIGTGSAGDFQITNAANTAPAINISHAGTGNAITANRPMQATSFIANNDGVGQGGFFTKSNGSGGGSAIEALNFGVDDGAAAFGVLNAASPRNTLFAQTTGTGAVAYLTHNGPSGNIIEFNNNFSPVASIDKTGKITATQFIGDGSLLTNVSGVAFPLTTTQSNVLPLFQVTNSGNGTAGRFVTNAASATEALSTEATGSSAHAFRAANSGTSGGAARFNTSNSANTSTSFAVTNLGLGAAASFSTNNTSNTIAAVSSSTNGTGSAISGQNTGTGNGFAGLFQNTNATNTFPAIQANTVGTGPGVRVIQNATSSGKGMDVIMQNTTGTQLGFTVDQQGLGGAANFTINNPASTSASLVGTTTGTGAAIQGTTSTGFTSVFGRRDGASNGFGGLFEVTNAGNTFQALKATTTGTGGAARFESSNAAGTSPNVESVSAAAGGGIRSVSTGTGYSGSFEIQNASNGSPSLSATTNGTGSAINGRTTSGTTGFAGSFETLNTSNTYQTLNVYQAGMGSAAYMNINNASNSNAAIGVETNGTGSVGNFNINNAANTAPAINISHAGTGNAITANRPIQATGFIGDGSLLTNLPPMSFPFAATNTTALGGVLFDLNTNSANAVTVANFSNLNASTTSNVLTVSNAGSGSTLVVNNTGTLGTGIFSNVSNPANALPAVRGTTSGIGRAGQFIINNTASAEQALFGQTNGTGAAIFANHAGASGNIAIFQSASANVARIDKTGQGFFNGGATTGGADIAEMFDVEGARESYEPGDVLVISESSDRTVEKSSTINSTKVVGVYATKPGVTLTEKGIDENLDQLVPMGVIGVIPTKVCLENGAIKRGDLLVTSSKSGHAMKAISAKGDGVFPAGVIIGKALENFEHGESGLIKVLVNVK